MAFGRIVCKIICFKTVLDYKSNIFLLTQSKSRDLMRQQPQSRVPLIWGHRHVLDITRFPRVTQHLKHVILDLKCDKYVSIDFFIISSRVYSGDRHHDSVDLHAALFYFLDKAVHPFFTCKISKEFFCVVGCSSCHFMYTSIESVIFHRNLQHENDTGLTEEINVLCAPATEGSSIVPQRIPCTSYTLEIIILRKSEVTPN